MPTKPVASNNNNYEVQLRPALLHFKRPNHIPSIMRDHPSNKTNKKKQVWVVKTVTYVEIIENDTIRVPNEIPEGVIDLDSTGKYHPNEIEYQKHLKEKELREYKKFGDGFKAGKEYTPNIKIGNRAVLIDWLSSVCVHYRISYGTLLLAIRIFDLYIQEDPTLSRERFQLVGVTALCIADKFNANREHKGGEPTHYGSCFIIVKHCEMLMLDHEAKEIAWMERNMLNTIQWSVHLVTPDDFIYRYMDAACLKYKVTQGDKARTTELNLMRYIIEVSSLKLKMYSFLPSMITASAIYITKKMLRRYSPTDKIWTPTLVYYTGFKLDDTLKNCIVEMNTTLYWFKLNHGKQGTPLFFITNKYLAEQRGRVAAIPPIQTNDLFIVKQLQEEEVIVIS